MIIKGVEFELDIFEVETVGKYEEGLANVLKVCEEATKCSSVAESVKMQCECVFDFFDNLFGKGAAKKIFGGKTSLVVCFEAFADFINEVEAQKEHFETIAESVKRAQIQVPTPAANRSERRTRAKKGVVKQAEPTV